MLPSKPFTYIKNNPEVIRVIIEQYARGVAALDNLDEETKNKVAKDLSLDADLLSDVTAKYDYTVVISDADVENLQDTIAFLVKIGNLEKEYTIDDYVKKEYVENADVAQYLK